MIYFQTMSYHYDSRKIKPGDTFISLPGGDRYEAMARASGAVDVIRLSRDELGPFANEVFGDPSSKLKVIGVTGTNGKTTVTHLIAHGLRESGCFPAVLGTLNAELTTPESFESLRRMRDHVNAGGTHFVMEVSSHAIHQNRISGIKFDARVLTNITPDHLDYHKTFEAYRAVKLSFLHGEGISIGPDQFSTIEFGFDLPLPGRFNRLNFQAAAAVLRQFGVSDNALKSATAPPGRFEPIVLGQPFDVVVDYAHTPDGLENVLHEARRIADARSGRLWVVFGCGGDRDRGKRPVMGEIAARIADMVVVTSDNPRSEDPAEIARSIVSGIPDPSRVLTMLDREFAIAAAIEKAMPGDVVLVAGKGHETDQIVGEMRHHFDDREVCRNQLKARYVDLY